MAWTTELYQPPEQLSPAEMGKRTHEMMQGIRGVLLETPEFKDALARKFFDRDDLGPVGQSRDGVYFDMGRDGYLVRWLHNPPLTQNRQTLHLDAVEQMKVYKYDPSRITESSTPVVVARMSLLSDFSISNTRGIDTFTRGQAMIESDFQGGGSMNAVARARTTLVEAEALNAIPTHFADLLPKT